jgi:hypothetical protein
MMMFLTPATGSAPWTRTLHRQMFPISVQRPNVTTPEENILAGVKMMRNIEDRYFNDPSPAWRTIENRQQSEVAAKSPLYLWLERR